MTVSALEPREQAALSPRPLPARGPLSEAATAAASDALAPETVRAYQRALDDIERRLAGHHLDDHSLSEALATMAAAGLGRSSLAIACAAARYAARLGGLPDPVGPSCSLVMRAHRRRSDPPRQAQAVDWNTADVAAAVAARDGVAGARDAALVAVMSDAMLRVGEAAALDLADVSRREDGSGLLAVRRSKTDQEGEGAELYLGPATVGHLDAWLEAAGLDPAGDGPLFRQVRRGGHVTLGRLSARSIRRIITSRCIAAGVEGASGHSLRVGGAVSLVRAGATLPEAQQAGRWQSPAMPAHYARGELAARGAVARLRHGN